MTMEQIPPGRLNDHEIHNLATHALDKIITSASPRLVVWDAMKRRLRTVSATACNAMDVIKKPTCLGMYDFEVRLQDIIDDFKAVYSRA